MTKAFPKEADVKAKVKRLLERHSWMWWMTPANGFGRSGIADFCALKRGIFMAIETKLGTNKPTEQQKAYLRSVRKEGGYAFVVSDVTLDAFEQWLSVFEYAKTAEDRSVLTNAVASMSKLYV